MNRIRLYFLVFIFLSSAVLCKTWPAEQYKYAFGTVNYGKNASIRITISNDSKDKMIIQGIDMDCDCLFIDSYKKELKPGENTKIKVTYASDLGELGNFAKKLYVRTNKGTKEFDLMGFVAGKNTKLLASKIEPNSIVSGKQNVYGYLVYFYSPSCKDCYRAKKIVNNAKSSFILREYDVSNKENRILFEAMAIAYKIPKDKPLTPPFVFIVNSNGCAYFQGKDIGNSVLTSLATKKILIDKTIAPWDEARKYIPDAQKEIVGRFSSFSISPILIAGLIDGLNPCAFATIIFLVSYMICIKKKTKSEVFWIGMFYTLGVVVTYFLIGLGLMNIIYRLNGFKNIARYFYVFMGILTLVLGIISIRDFLFIRKIEKLKRNNDDKQGVVLRVPKWINWKIYGFTEKLSQLRYFVFISFFLGSIVSLLELICTGQVYLPTITYMTQLAGYKTQSIVYLMIYSLMFVLPLMLIFLLILFGIDSEAIDSFSKKYIVPIKMANSFILLFFSIYMFKVGLQI
ncbi:MAG: hypothetical protein A2252_05840 [Elusimicrobia bacterium RIFOXYA2_FULL_39_19]|nr:MAG: hypothetical protein A2252_05840 [Elusimicrobia bacterium RIFOXYA2_FULL_39_19]